MLCTAPACTACRLPWRWLKRKERLCEHRREESPNAHAQAQSATGISVAATRTNRGISVDGEKVPGPQVVEGDSRVLRRLGTHEKRGVEMQDERGTCEVRV